MAKNAAKKRRSAKPKVSRKIKNTFRYKKPDIRSAVVKEMWDNNLSAKANMAKMGLQHDANSALRPSAAKVAAKSVGGVERMRQDCEVSRLFGVLDTDDLKVIDRNLRRRPLSDEDQRYTVKLVARYGVDHEAMARDIKINYKQLTLGKLRRMCDTLLSLEDDQRVVHIPERVLKEALSLAGGDRGEEGGGSGELEEDTPAAMEEDEEEEEEQPVVVTIPKKKKKKIKKKQGGSGSQNITAE